MINLQIGNGRYELEFKGDNDVVLEEIAAFLGDMYHAFTGVDREAFLELLKEVPSISEHMEELGFFDTVQETIIEYPKVKGGTND